MDWNEDTITRLRVLWDEGHSTAEIGRRMGVSKNAVVGKAHRMALPARPSPIRRGEGASADRAAPAPRRAGGPATSSQASSSVPPNQAQYQAM